jgi:hypothetical protein
VVEDLQALVNRSVGFTIALKGLCAVMQARGEVDIAIVHAVERNATWIVSCEHLRGGLVL